MVGIAIGCSIGGITVIVVAIILIKHYCCSSYGGGCGCYNCERPRCPSCKCRCKKPTFCIKSKTVAYPDKNIVSITKCEDSVKTDPSPFKLADDSDEGQDHVSFKVINGDARKPAKLPPLRNNQIEPLQETTKNEHEINKDNNKMERERLHRRQTDSALNGILSRQDGETSTNGQLNNPSVYPPPPANYIPVTRQQGEDNPPPPTYAEAVNDSTK